MPIYTSDQNVKSGIPLGGLGAGKFELMPSGVLDHFTFLNNAHKPLSSGDLKSPSGVCGFHFGAFVKDKGKKIVKILQTIPLAEYPTVDSIKFNGSYPFAHCEYLDGQLPVKIELEAFSPLIRRDEKNSGLPLAFFRFKLTNPFSRTIPVTLFAAGRNIIGEWPLGRFNQINDTVGALNLYFFNKKTQSQDPTAGEMSLSLLKNAHIETSYLGEWNMQARPFVFDRAGVSLEECLSALTLEGTLPNSNSEKVVQAESTQLAGALAAKVLLKPKTSVTVTFVYSWFFPNFGEGRMYETWFRSVADVAAYGSEKYTFLYNQMRTWLKELQGLGIDGWLKDALVNNLYPLSSGSLWTKRARFSLMESPETVPLSGTLDVRFYGSWPLLYLFPQLELKEMLQFAEAQRPQGYIPHDLGSRRTDLASNSTNGLFWKDLNSKFILLTYRDYIFTKDEGFLKRMYPFVKKAFYWLVATDKNKDFLPDNEGADQTFDLWEFHGTNSYTSGLFLAGLLALEKMAGLMKDADMEAEARDWFKKGRASFEKKLWHKQYFMAYNNGRNGLSNHQLSHQVKAQKINISCMAAQLTGQWVAHLLGLGYIVSQDKVKKALETILNLNGGASSFGAVNSVLPTGEKDKTNPHAENVWFGITYSVACLAIYEGFEKEGLELAKKAWDNAAQGALNPWNQPDMVSSYDGNYLFGDHEMRNMVIWCLLFSLAKKDKKIEKFIGD